MFVRIVFFFFNDTATTEIYTLSLHDALPICQRPSDPPDALAGEVKRTEGQKLASALVAGYRFAQGRLGTWLAVGLRRGRSEEHTSELQSRQYLVCRLLLEKKKQDTLLFFIFL